MEAIQRRGTGDHLPSGCKIRREEVGRERWRRRRRKRR
jgi:hypothetical protein